MPDGLYVGLMSGTSVDGIDCALVAIGDAGLQLKHTLQHPIPDTLRTRIAAVSHSGHDEIEQMGALDRELGKLFGEATRRLLESDGLARADIRAIGSHGQTIRHRPPSAGHSTDQSFTLQIGDPNTIAEVTGITTVADFRRRDIAAGGEGAPLAPAFHARAFGRDDATRAVVNIGGIANVSLLQGQRLSAGFDTGPGNTLMDHWVQRHRGEHFDRDGEWAGSAESNAVLLAKLLAHPYLQLSGPRSTGKEAFNLAWLDGLLADLPGLSPAEVQSTLAQYTAATIARPILASEPAVEEVYVCGGGAHNGELMRRLAQALPGINVADTGALGIAPDWVEAATFAWLAHCNLAGLPGNSPVVTGARGERILGAVYPGGSA